MVTQGYLSKLWMKNARCTLKSEAILIQILKRNMDKTVCVLFNVLHLSRWQSRFSVVQVDVTSPCSLHKASTWKTNRDQKSKYWTRAVFAFQHFSFFSTLTHSPSLSSISNTSMAVVHYRSWLSYFRPKQASRVVPKVDRTIRSTYLWAHISCVHCAFVC